MDVPKTKIETYARERPAELHRAQLAETRYLSFNTQRPPLSDGRVRRALSLAIDRQKIVERVLLGGQEPTSHFLPPALSEGRSLLAGDSTGAGSSSSPASRLLPPSPFTAVAEAQQLLSAAGFPGGKGFPRFEITAWSQSQVATLEAIQAMWRQHLGINVALALRDAKVHLSALAAGNYDIAFVTTLIDVLDAASVLADFATGAPGNYPHWSDAAFDAAIARADFATAESRLAEAAPVAPLYVNTRNFLMSSRVRGWQEDALWSRSYLHVYLEEK